MLIGLTWLSVAGLNQGYAADLLPEVPAATRLQAPLHQIPVYVGYSSYWGSYLFAGDFVIESDPYDSATSRASAIFTVRRAADHVALYTIRQGSGRYTLADSVAFSDGILLAVRVRDTVDGPARISVYNLATGTRLFEVAQPDARAGDNFGSDIWFTEDRILVAAPGRDYRKPDAGALYIFNRSTGRFIGVVGPGVKNAAFGHVPYGGYGMDAQPPRVPYVQVSGKGALVVHGNRAFRFFKDKLQPLVIPRQGKNTVLLKDALVVGDRIVLTTAEQNSQGYTTSGRVIGFDLVKGRMLYQLGAAAVKGSYEFPSGIAASNGRLFVHDALAGFPGTSQRGALHVHDLATGKRITGLDFPAIEGAYQDSSSLTLSGGLIWLRTITSRDGQAPALAWLAYNAATLEETLRLTAPGVDSFRGGAPLPVGDNRFAVVAIREESNWPIMASSIAPAASSSSVIIINPWTHNSAGVLIYDSSTSSWTHRLLLEGEAASSYVSEEYPDDALRVISGASPGTFRVSLAEKTAREILDFNTVLPSTTPAATLEGHLRFTPQPGYAYDLLRQGAGETGFSLVRTVGLGDGALHDDIVPYADYQDAIPYRLDGTQFSRRLSVPEGEPVTLGNQAPTALASDGTRLAVRIPGSDSSAPGTVRVLDEATGATVFTLSPSGHGTGPIAITDAYIAIGAPNAGYPGSIDVFDAVTGVRLRTIPGGKAFGSSFVISGNLLAATWVDDIYNGGAYTHNPKLAVYDLPSGTRLRTIPLVSTTSLYSWDSPPVDLVGAGGRVAVRTMAPGGSFADAGHIRVIDLDTGSTVYELSSPSPEVGDYFGGWLAAAGNRLVIGSSGTSEVFIYDFATGVLSHTLALADRPDGIMNYGSGIPRLSIDAQSDLLSWFVSDDPEATTATYIFDLRTGLEEAKVLPPKAAPSTFQFQTYLGGAVLSAGRLIAFTTWEKNLITYPLGDALAVPLLETSENLAPLPVVRLEFSTRKGVSYQAEASSDEGGSWNVIGDKYYGDGQPATVRITLTDDPSPDTLRFRLQTAWEPAPKSPWGGLGF